MTISKLKVSNFKGIGKPTDFEIRPITVFIGANSSGKSSCIHALVSLAQTLKLGNGTPALVLDDDFAHVHLGRFVEIAHSHSYRDAITIGIEIGDHKFSLTDRKEVEGNVTATYSFKSTLRTQEVYVDSARIAVGGSSFSVKRGTKPPYRFIATDEDSGTKYDALRIANYLFQIQPSEQDMAKEKNRDWFERFWLLRDMQAQVERELRDTRYLGPFRQSPLRRYPFRGATATEVGAQGEGTITLLATEHVQSRDRVHAKQVNKWLNSLGLAQSVELARVGTSDLFEVSLTLSDGRKLPIADLGYGLSQVLPVITQCSFAPKGSTLLFEQPELHLHENAAKKLAGVFVETAEQKNAHLVLETHSKELIYEFLSFVKSGQLSADDLAIYVVQRTGGASSYKRVGIALEDGYLEVDDPWVKAVAEQ